MTVMEAKEKYGAKPDNAEGLPEGYVSCCNCPCNNETGCQGEHYICDGYDDAYDSIAKFFNRNEVKSESVTDNNAVTHPSHYTQGNIQCIDAMESAFGKEAVATWCKLNSFKYIWRAEHKNGMEDIDKAIWYLNKFKELSA